MTYTWKYLTTVETSYREFYQYHSIQPFYNTSYYDYTHPPYGGSSGFTLFSMDNYSGGSIGDSPPAGITYSNNIGAFGMGKYTNRVYVCGSWENPSGNYIWSSNWDGSDSHTITLGELFVYSKYYIKSLVEISEDYLMMIIAPNPSSDYFTMFRIPRLATNYSATPDLGIEFFHPDSSYIRPGQIPGDWDYGAILFDGKSLTQAHWLDLWSWFTMPLDSETQRLYLYDGTLSPETYFDFSIAEKYFPELPSDFRNNLVWFLARPLHKSELGEEVEPIDGVDLTYPVLATNQGEIARYVSGIGYEFNVVLDDWDYENCEYFQHCISEGISYPRFSKVWYVDDTTVYAALETTHVLGVPPFQYTIWKLSTSDVPPFVSGSCSCGPITTTAYKTNNKHGKR